MPYNRRFLYKRELFDSKGSYAHIGRANYEGQSIFYGCIHDKLGKGQEEPLPRIVTLEEVSSFYRDAGSNGIEVITYSGWRPRRDLNLLCIPSFGLLENPCKLSLALDELWASSAYASDETYSNKIKELSSLFTSDNGIEENKHVYERSSEFANYVYSNLIDVDGILYPSVQSRGAGVNIAIKGNVVDDYMGLVDVAVCNLYKRDKKAKLINLYHSSVEIEPFNYTRHKTYNNQLTIETKNEFKVNFIHDR